VTPVASPLAPHAPHENVPPQPFGIVPQLSPVGHDAIGVHPQTFVVPPPPHVFGAVADPPSAGVGISRNDPLSHPKHLVGIGTFLPVRPTFDLARRMNPALKSIGVVWNPGESNSEAFTKKARAVCADMGLQLLEATVDNSSGVYEAANSLVARGADVLWVGGDVTVLVALDSAIAAARWCSAPASR